MKANDNIPREEMLLAEMLAATMARGLKWTDRVEFCDSDGQPTKHHDRAVAVCAVGALALVGRRPRGKRAADIASGNDNPPDVNWDGDDRAQGSNETLGWAFRCAMADS